MEEFQVKQEVSVNLPTEFGDFQLMCFTNGNDTKEHLALVMGDVKDKPQVLTRIHSECLTGDIFGSLRCDCGEQLHLALDMIANSGTGILIYLRQEGRGIGLLAKLHTYMLQEQGYDTVDANTALGYQADEREYNVAVGILKHLGVKSIVLLTNNPSKTNELAAKGVIVESVNSIHPTLNIHNRSYLETKAKRMGHTFDLTQL